MNTKVQKSPNITFAFFNLRLTLTTGGLNWDENGSIQVHKSKIKKIPCEEKFSAPPKDDPLKSGFLGNGSAENGQNGKNWQKWVEYN